MKKGILGFILGFIIASVIAVTAAFMYNAKDIKFESNKTEVDNVNDALNEIFSSGNATEDDILANKTALVNGTLITGTRELIPTLVDTQKIALEGYGSTSKSTTVNPGEYLVLIAISTSSDNKSTATFTHGNTCDMISTVSNGYRNGDIRPHHVTTYLYHCNVTSPTAYTVLFTSTDGSWQTHSRSMFMQIFKY